MLEYVRINVSEAIDVNNTNGSKKCDICHYWNFLGKGFKLEPYVSYGCHNLIQKAMKFNVATVSAKGSNYRIHFWYTRKDDDIMKISDLNETSGFFFVSCGSIKKSEYILSK